VTFPFSPFPLLPFRPVRAPAGAPRAPQRQLAAGLPPAGSLVRVTRFRQYLSNLKHDVTALTNHYPPDGTTARALRFAHLRSSLLGMSSSDGLRLHSPRVHPNVFG
jgi:hypothetical protein